jgi:HD-GYP domain-containing protein (c-di-GMP phosphodiesterase class II)
MSAPSIRLAELLASLSLATDAAIGDHDEGALRVSVIAVGLGRATGAPVSDIRAAYFAALLRHLGATSTSAAEAVLTGDDFYLKRAVAVTNPGKPQQMLGNLFKGVGSGAGKIAAARAVMRFVSAAPQVIGLVRTSCEVRVRLAKRLGLDDDVQRALGEYCETYDGKGLPRRVAGDALSTAGRLMVLADVAAVFHRIGGVAAARAEVSTRAGRQLDPALAKCFAAEASALLAPLDRPSVWDLALEAEPPPHAMFASTQIGELATVLADYADLKSGFTVGHSPAVAALAVSAGQQLGLRGDELDVLRTAALLHDLGRVAVSNGIWDKPGALNAAEWERVRLHPYHTERMLSLAPALRPIAELAGADHERLDGSGYFRSARPARTAARALAAADVYQALLETRPHRPALTKADAGRTLAEEARAGRLDREAVAAVLAAAGHRAERVPSAWPAGLTDREVEVLRLLARGLQNKEIGKVLFISSRTVQNHTISIYGKIGVETRGAAALFATEHDLLRH